MSTISTTTSAGGGGVITALNSATANELVTIGATTTELDAETNLTFANNQLKLPVYDVGAPALISASGATTIGIAFDSNGFHLVHAGGSKLFFRRDGIYFGTQKVSFGSSTGGTDITLKRDADAILAQKSGTDIQEYRIYNTTTDSEFASLGWKNTADVFTIETERGTGTDFPIALMGGKVGIGTATPSVHADLTLEGGALALKETTIPTADADYGKIWTESDNTLHFQSGAGVEYTIDITAV